MNNGHASRSLCPSLRAALVLIPVGVAFASLMIGPYDIGPLEVLKILAGKLWPGWEALDSMAVGMILQVRLPRIMASAMIGAGLSVSGAVFQGLFKNPLASPYTLGVSNGAGFGAALAILLSGGVVLVQVFAVGFGMLSLGIVFVLAARSRRSAVTLVLAGMLVGALFSSLISLLKFIADPYEKLPQIVFWLMGSFSSVDYPELRRILPFYIISLAVLHLFRWRLNILSLGDREAQSMGVNVRADRAVVIAAGSVLTALSVSVAGVVGWVGIVVPHLARLLVGPDFRVLLPVSVSLGASYLSLIDGICRTLTASEIPLGVVTGIVGAPLFIYFIYKRRVNW